MIYVLIAIAAGILMDLAAFERLRLSLAGIWATREEFSYLGLLFPRVIATVVASAMIGFGIYQQPEKLAWVIGGGVLFTASIAYAAYLILSKKFD